MALKIKNIIYPNMYQAHGISVDRQEFTLATSSQTVDSSYASQETITNAIKGIHEFLTNELELVEVPVDGEMDIDNIIEPPIHLTTTSMSSIPTDDILLEPLYNAFINATDSNTFKPIYGFKYYTFNDELNERKPLYLKINYGLFLLSKLGVNMRIRFAFAIEVEIKNSIDGSTITSSVLCNASGQNTALGYKDCYTQTMEQKDSIGSHYDGVLYVNIFPKLGIRHSTVTSSSTNITYMTLNKVSYINFFLQRKEDYFIFMPFSYNTSQSDRNIVYKGYNSTSISTGFYSYDGLSTYSTNDNVHVPFLSNRIVGNNTRAIFRSIDIDPVSSNIYENFNLCVGYNTMIQSSGAEIVIDNGNGTKSKYVTLSGIDSYHYLNSNKLAMIIKTDDIINE